MPRKLTGGETAVGAQEPTFTNQHGGNLHCMVLAAHVGAEKRCWGLKYGGAIGGSKGPAATNNDMFVPRDINNLGNVPLLSSCDLTVFAK